MASSISGVFLNIPILTLLVKYAVEEEVVTITQVILSTVVIGGIILGLLPLLFKLGNKLITFDHD